ncbi:MAG TPA: hypothetical protein VKQ05_08025 [Gemmatimonadales bacterium]|nr:hypothetical protein [Gemmatimonadales bacterium]
MRKVSAFGLVLGTAAVVAGAWGACKSPAAPAGILLMGSWGSPQGHLAATEVNTVFTGACGSGNTIEPIMLDKHGHFDILGSYGVAGSARSDARFTGAVGDRTVTLKVRMADSTSAVGPITLNLGQQPALATCH